MTAAALRRASCCGCRIQPGMRPSWNWKSVVLRLQNQFVFSTPGEVVADSSNQDDVAAMISGTDTTAPLPWARATFHF